MDVTFHVRLNKQRKKKTIIFLFWVSLILSFDKRKQFILYEGWFRMILIDFAKFLEYMFVLRESAYKENGK